MIPYGCQDIDAADIEAVAAVLRSDFLTQGPVVPQFEAALASRVGAPHAVAASSASAALYLAYRALGIGPGDLVWTAPITFVATANMARLCGAEVDFVDVLPETGLMDPVALKRKLETAARPPKLVVPVHLAGQPCDMDEISALARSVGANVVEDASHAVGAIYRDTPIGACAQSDIAVFSFHPVKMITTGEGGMAMTADATLAERMALLSSHGVTRDPAQKEGAFEGGWTYEQVDIGHNMRLTDLAAALGLSQLERLTEFLEKRSSLAKRYDEMLENTPVRPLKRCPDRVSSWHLYVVRLADAAQRRTAFDAMRGAGIGVNVHYIPVPRQPFWRAQGTRPEDFPGADAYYSGALSLPLQTRLTEAEQDKVVRVLQESLA